MKSALDTNTPITVYKDSYAERFLKENNYKNVTVVLTEKQKAERQRLKIEAEEKARREAEERRRKEAKAKLAEVETKMNNYREFNK